MACSFRIIAPVHQEQAVTLLNGPVYPAFLSLTLGCPGSDLSTEVLRHGDTMSDVESTDLQQAAVRAIESLSHLTYQQKQLLKSGELSAVFNQVVKKRRFSTLVIGAIALLSTYFAVRTAAAGSFAWVSTTFAVVYSWWTCSRIAKQNAVARSVRHFTESRPEAISPVDTLAADLRLNHRLSYNQQQSIKAGDIAQVASEVAASRRRNGRTMLLGIWPVCAALFVLDSFQHRDPNMPDALLLQDFLSIIVGCIILIACATVFGVRELRIASRLERTITQLTA